MASAQVQRFSYDYLGRLTQAWSKGTAGCAASPSQAAEAGAAGPHWDQYAYDNASNLTAQVATPPRRDPRPLSGARSRYPARWRPPARPRRRTA